MTEREKLIERIHQCLNECGDCKECRYRLADGKCREKMLADYLLSHGVTIPVRCAECKHQFFKNFGEDIGDVSGCKMFGVAIPLDRWCSFGERKDNE